MGLIIIEQVTYVIDRYEYINEQTQSLKQQLKINSKIKK